jgi:hypothetical protein
VLMSRGGPAPCEGSYPSASRFDSWPRNQSR